VLEELETKKCSCSLDILYIVLICGVVLLAVVIIIALLWLYKRERGRRSFRSLQQNPLCCLPGATSSTGREGRANFDISSLQPCLCAFEEKLKFIPEELKIDGIPYEVEELIIKLDAKRAFCKHWYHVGRKLGVSVEDLGQLKREEDREGGSPTRCLLSFLGTSEEVVSLREFVRVLYDLRRSDIGKQICEFYKAKRCTAPNTATAV